MVYISNGQVLDSWSQSPWRLSLITDFFWRIAEFVVLFFKTLLQQDVKKGGGYRNSSDSRHDDGRGPPGNPPRRMGRINHLQGPSPPPMGGGWMRKVNVCCKKQTTRHAHA
ncbi:selenoprotein K-like [Heterocephalus glaber]|uniref:Selenoprotein K n=1 Tax=Heterocephalus glaber TaxID=10181 RepID=A0AAX6QQB8_HETGA|nr:selenoprotein K-like [Heterocephalus glaber]